MTDTRTPRPSVHDPLSKSYAIDQITDVEELRRVAHRMWEAFRAAHSQAAHVIGVLIGDTECAPCAAAFHGQGEACEQWHQWQAKVHDGFDSV